MSINIANSRGNYGALPVDGIHKTTNMRAY